MPIHEILSFALVVGLVIAVIIGHIRYHRLTVRLIKDEVRLAEDEVRLDRKKALIAELDGRVDGHELRLDRKRALINELLALIREDIVLKGVTDPPPEPEAPADSTSPGAA